MNRIILFGLIYAAVSLKIVEAQSNYIGKSPNGSGLKVSPDGKWLMVSSEIRKEFNVRLARLSIWNLCKREMSQSISCVNNFSGRYYFQNPDSYGWTPDNRIYYYPQSKIINISMDEIFLISNPDGSDKVTFDAPRDFAFSAKGDRLFSLTNPNYRIYDTHSGQLLFRREWNIQPDEFSLTQYSDYDYFLSPNGEKILTVERWHWRTGKREEERDTGIREIVEARTGKSLARNSYDANPKLYLAYGDFLDNDTYVNYRG